ncbi:hypothetical protein DIPPA_01239 [Diplonema papillatum]|nr:hypothetical protein DIPPA_01239 [Diplonema papillatum]
MSDDAAENAFVQYLRDNRIHDCLEKQMRHLRAHPKVAPLDAIAQWAASEKSRSTGKVSDDLLALTKKGALLGSGSFAKVYLGSLPNGKFIAVKEVRLSGEGGGEDGEEQDLLAEIRSAQSEIRLRETVRHPNTGPGEGRPSGIRTLALAKKGVLLGSGSFAKVYLGSLPNGKFIAVKEVRLSGEGGGEDGEEQDLLAEIRSAQSEIRLRETVRHPNTGPGEEGSAAGFWK